MISYKIMKQPNFTIDPRTLIVRARNFVSMTDAPTLHRLLNELAQGLQEFVNFSETENPSQTIEQRYEGMSDIAPPPIIFKLEDEEAHRLASSMKPCPFCGSGMIDEDDAIYPTTRSRRLWQAGCSNLGCSAHVLGWTPQEAVEHWNTRTFTQTHTERKHHEQK